jgi:hypothetical protein
MLVARLNIDHTQAAMIIGSAADVRSGLLLRPPYSMRVAIPRSVLGL